MAEPKITAAKCSISYKADDGYRSEETFGSMREGADDPIAVLSSTVLEASRFLALFGHPERATEEASKAVNAVADWQRATQTAKGEQA